MVITDIEWLLCPTPLKDVLIYRYRSGVLRRQVLQQLRDLAKQSSVEVTYCDVAEVKARWSVPGLFDAMRICDLSSHKNGRAIRDLLTLTVDAPGAPTAILMPVSFGDVHSTAGVLRIEEPYVTGSNLAKVLRFLVASADLISPDLKFRQNELHAHLRRWIEDRGRALLPEAMREFDHAVLSLSNAGCRDAVTTGQSFDVTARSRFVASLRRFLASEDAFALSDLLQALAIKKERGWSSLELVGELVEATLRVAESSCLARVVSSSGGRKRPSGAVIVAEEVALLWSALLLAWSHSFASDLIDLDQINVLVEFEHLCRDFRKRLENLAGDPLSGCWTRLRTVFGIIADIDEDDRAKEDARKNVLRFFSRQDLGRRGYPWLEKLHRMAVRALRPQGDTEPKTLESGRSIVGADLASFADVMGQKHLVQELRERFESGQHDRPLLLTGPEGSGKRTIARLYAKALLCEADRSEVEPCGGCQSCGSFKGGANFGYFEIDLGHPEGLSHVYAVIDRLRYVPVTHRRVVLINNADRSLDSINAFLKTLEAGAESTSFILLAENECGIDPAVRSRSASYPLRRLSQADAWTLAGRWLQSGILQSEGIELAALNGRGLPGEILNSCRIVARGAVSTLDQAKESLGLSWGVEILHYWRALVSEEFQLGDALNSLSGMKPEDAIRRLRSALYQLSESAAIHEPAFLGLQTEIRTIQGALEKYAGKLGMARARLWQELAAHWADDAIIDDEGLAAVSETTRDMLCGRIKIEGHIPSTSPPPSSGAWNR